MKTIDDVLDDFTEWPEGATHIICLKCVAPEPVFSFGEYQENVLYELVPTVKKGGFFVAVDCDLEKTCVLYDKSIEVCSREEYEQAVAQEDLDDVEGRAGVLRNVRVERDRLRADQS